MTLNIDFWQLVSLAIGLVGAWAGFAKLFFAQVDRRLDERFAESEAGLESLRAFLRQHATEETALIGRLDGEGRAQLERISRIEAELRSQPSHTDLARLHARVDEVAGLVKHIAGENSAQTRILNLVYESLIGGKD